MDFNSIFKYLSDLRKNNNRDWFAENKNQYTYARNEWISFVESIIKGISEFDPEIGLLQPKDCLFRINRDIRFSPDKTPYNSHFSAAMIPGGKKNHKPGYYIMVKPGELSYTGGGIWHPSSDHLAMIRQEIDYNPSPLKEILAGKEFQKTFKLEGEKLKRPPKGYEKDHPDVELLKHKDFVAGRSLSDKVVLSDTFENVVLEGFRTVSPMNNYFSTAMEL